MVAGTAYAAIPIEYPGNPTGMVDYRIENPKSTTYDIPGKGTITLLIKETEAGWELSFISTVPITRFVAKGSNSANVYDYMEPGVKSDSGIHCPIAGGSGKWAAFSWVGFCIGTETPPPPPDDDDDDDTPTIPGDTPEEYNPGGDTPPGEELPLTGSSGWMLLVGAAVATATGVGIRHWEKKE